MFETKAQEVREKLKRLAQEEKERDLREVLSSRAGRRLAWLIIDQMSGAMNPSFSGETTHETAYAEGRRSVGLELWAEIQRVDDSAFVQMLSEELTARRQAAQQMLAAEQEDEET